MVRGCGCAGAAATPATPTPPEQAGGNTGTAPQLRPPFDLGVAITAPEGTRLREQFIVRHSVFYTILRP